MIILVHEGGHFVVAKKSGVKVNEFALGMGPKLFSFTKGETTYSLRAFPIGGFCAMEGEDEDSVAPRAFNNAKIWKRMIIIVAGAFMNIVLGLVLMFITLLPKDGFSSTQVSVFSPDSFSLQSGLKQGDVIKKINGYAVNTSTDFSFALYTLPVSDVDGSEISIYREDCVFDLTNYVRGKMIKEYPDEVYTGVNTALNEACVKIADCNTKEDAYAVFCDYYDQLSELLDKEDKGKYPEIEEKETRKRYRTDMAVIRDGERVELKDVDFMTYRTSDNDDPQLRIDFYVAPVEKNFGTLITETFSETVSVVRMVWGTLIGLVKGQFSFNDLSGPVGIASAITDVAGAELKSSGFGSAVMSIVYVMMIITVNLGIVNMLPFPALDGGRFLMLLIEWIFRKPVPRKIEAVINTVGLVSLLGLSAVIAVKDIWKIFSGG